MIVALRITLAAVLGRSAVAAALGTAGALLAAGPRPAAHQPLDSGALWLHLPIALVAIVAVAAALEAWPGFGAGRPGRAVVDRLATGPADGALAASLAALLAAALCLAGSGAAFATLRGIGPDRPLTAATPWRFADSAGVAALHAGRATATLEIADARTDRVTLRPRLVAAPGGSLAAATLRVTRAADGTELVPPTTVPWDGARIDVPIAASDRAIVIERLPGPGLAVVLDAARVTAARPATITPTANAAIAALWALLPIGAALGAATLGRRRLGLGVLTFVGFAVLMASPGLSLAPHVGALEAAAAGHSCLASAPLPGVSS